MINHQPKKKKRHNTTILQNLFQFQGLLKTKILYSAYRIMT